MAVDEYDAPANTCLFSEDHGHQQQFSKIAEVFKSRFFAVMKQACSSVVRKYWITGVLPAFRDGISPLCATDDISSRPQFNSLCGLTQEEVSSITRTFLRTLPVQRLDLIQEELKRWYGGYTFSSGASSTTPSTPSTLYNPQEVFNYLRMVQRTGELTKYRDDSSVLHSDSVLRAIPNGGPLSFDDFFLDALDGKLRAQIMNAFGADDVKQIGRDANITWTLLYYFGVFTKDAQGDDLSCVRIPNKSMVELVRWLEGLELGSQSRAYHRYNDVSITSSNLGNHTRTRCHNHAPRSAMMIHNHLSHSSRSFCVQDLSVPSRT